MKYFPCTKLLGLLAVFFMVSCTAEPPALLKVGVIQWAGYEPVILARQLGYLEQDKVKLVELPSNTESMVLLHEGRLDAATLTLDEALSVMNMGTELTIVLVFDFSNGADVLLVKPSIKSLMDIRHRRIGVESTGVGALLFHAVLDYAKLEDDDVEVVYLPSDEHEAAYMNGKVDALVTFDPIKSRLEKRGAHVLFDSRLVPDLIVDVLAVRTDQLEKQRQNILQLVQGYAKARDYMKLHAEKSLQLMAPRLQVSPDELDQSYQGLILPSLSENQAYFSGSPSKFQRHVQKVYRFMKNENMLNHELSLSQIQDGSFVKRVTP